MKKLRPTCSHCIYWTEDHTADPATAGHCHRYPPGIYINPQSGVVVQKFPTTDHHHWCGEWNGDDTRLVQALHMQLEQSI
ncbi:hypothetical protein HPQ64_14650 [Rhizobiales bacterium]|uniref:hypothetical protein n=1 Tax=Hongsoonwoonella zoysiae TaxID=2821844 RepID=UPI00156018B2|nr:hypothetical protein [Hongsoonwoonella zoysiae]NRG18930.1 hypothetical protein [Hongsoonwoonella zoysiae]